MTQTVANAARLVAGSGTALRSTLNPSVRAKLLTAAKRSGE